MLPVVLFDPVRQTFLLGQVNIILALMVVADLTMDLPLPRGILVGLAAAIKVTPIILIPYLFLTRQGRAGLRAVGAFAAAAVLAAAVNTSTSWSYWTHYIRDPQRAGMLSWIGNQGVLGAAERMLGHTVATPTTFVIVVTRRRASGLLIAAGAYRRSSPVLGLLVVEATESLASPVSWSHHFIWMVLLVAWLALAEDRPRYGEWYALAVAVLLVGRPLLVGPARARASLRRPGLAHPRSATPTCWSSSCCSSGRRSGCGRSTLVRPLRLGRRAMAPSGAGPEGWPSPAPSRLAAGAVVRRPAGPRRARRRGRARGRPGRAGARPRTRRG